jgi:zinc D-Ala-D-Ala carboxypeptidase
MPTLVGMISPTSTDLQLSPHFWLSEFEQSQTAARNGLRNEANATEINQLKRLAARAEEVRTLLGNVPIVPSSGLRTLIVNGLVTGVITPDQVPLLSRRPDLMTRLRAQMSDHRFGRALDFTAPAFGSPRDIVERVMHSSIAFGQLIYEGTWVHFAIEPEGEAPKRQVLTAVFSPGQKVRYLPGLV